MGMGGEQLLVFLKNKIIIDLLFLLVFWILKQCCEVKRVFSFFNLSSCFVFFFLLLGGDQESSMKD